MLGLREVYRNECGVLMSAANAGLFLFVLGKLIHLQSVGNSGCSKMLGALITSALPSPR